MPKQIELVLEMGADGVKVLHCREISGPANRGTTISAAEALMQSLLSSPSIARRTQQQIENQIKNEWAQDNQRIGIQLIGRITQGMMTDPTGVLAKTRADQIFGMLELAELLELNDDMRQFLENHHAAILRGLR